MTFNSQAFSLAYYLFTFVAIEAACFLAWSHWRRSLSLVPRRFAMGFGILGLIRLLLSFLGGWFSATAANEAANQALIVISLGILAWNFAPYFSNRSVLGTALLVGNSVFALVFLSVHLAYSSGNDEIFAVIWLLWQIALGLSTVINLFQDLNRIRILVIMSFMLFLGGSLLQLILEPTQGLAFIRFAEMIAYPVLAVAVYQEVIESLNQRSAELQDLSQTSLEQIQGLISLFETTKDITSALDLPQVLDGAVKGVVSAVGVDQCAVALPEEEEASQLRMVATYNPRREGRSEAVTFPVNDQPAIKHALERLREVEISSGYDTAQFEFLFLMMGVRDETGPLLIQPLILRDTAIGVLIVSNPYSKGAFGPTKSQLVKAMANQIAIAIDNARAYQVLATKSQQLAWTLRNQEQDAGRRQAAMEAELQKSREEVTIISQRLYEQDTLARKSQKQLTGYHQQITHLNEQIKNARETLNKLSLENQQYSTLTDTQKKQLEQARQTEKELAALRNRVSELDAEASETAKLAQALTEAQQRSQKLAHALRSSRAKIQQLAGMPASMTSPQSHNELENISCGLFISDSKGIVNRVNTAATKLLNRDSKSLVGRKLTEITIDEKWHQALDKLSSSEGNLVLATFTVDDKVIKASISPMVASNNQQTRGNVVILYDATEEFESQRIRDEFVASLSQDLRTPMTSITGYIDLLLGESVGVIVDMQRKFLQRVQANIERMDLMLKELIGVTAIDAGQFGIKPIPLDMAEVIEDAIINAKAQLTEKEITLELDLPEEMPPIEVDPDCIKQVMANLLGNAIKITPVGGDMKVSAIVTADDNHTPGREEENWLQVSVTDSGGGIAEKDIKRVFDRFYMAESPLIQGLGETGVGLSLVKYLIEAHDGKVWLDTDIGRGSSFHFTLLIKDYFNDPWQELDVPPLDLNSDLPDI